MPVHHFFKLRIQAARLFPGAAFLIGVLAFTGLLNAGQPPVPTSTALTFPAPSTPINVGVLLTATVSPDTVTGTVSFYDGATIIGSGALIGGVATFNYIPFFAGHRLLRAYYRGATHAMPSYSPTGALNVLATPSGSFGAYASYGFSGQTLSPVIADFNHDGAPDIAVFQSSGQIGILLNSGLVSYTTSTPISGLGSSGAIAIGDFNSDGNTDLAVADTQNSQVVIYMGNGDGTFLAGVNYVTGSQCNGIVAADFTGDGVIDVATSNSDGNVNLFVNNGDGTFQAAATTGVSDMLTGIVTGDFNGDGIADVAVVDPFLGGVDVILGGPGGFNPMFSTHSTGNPGSATVADFNGDGNSDIAIIDTVAKTAILLLGNGTGDFVADGSVASFPFSPTAIASGDIDGDGFTDFAAIGGDLNCVAIASGDGTFYAPDCISFSGIDGIAIGSIDLNGTTGIARTSANTVAMYEGGPFPPVIVSGDMQTVQAGAGAPVPFEVQLTDFEHNYMMAGLNVTFTAPYPGPGGYFNGLGNAVTVPTQDDGTATAPEFVSNSALGTYAVSAGQPNNIVNFMLNNAQEFVGETMCSYSISPSAIVFNSAGGSTVVNVTPTPPTCAWSASTGVPWAVPSAENFAGATSVTITAGANLSGVSQSADMLVAGQYVTLLQWGTNPIVADAPPGPAGAEVTDMIGYGFSSGCGANPLDYCPNDTVTRAEAAVLLVRGVYGSDNFMYSLTPHFNDVSPTTFGFPWIQKLFELGITTGCGNNDFCPTATLPRDQAAVLLVRSRLGATTPFDFPPAPYFSDVPANAYAFNYIQRLRVENITMGCAPNLYCPSDPITRGELAAFIMRGLTNQFLPTGTSIITEVSSPNGTVRSLGVYPLTTIVLTGQNTHFDNTSTIVVAGGAIATNLTVLSPTYATVDVSGVPPVNPPVGNSPPHFAVQLDTPESIIITTGLEEAVIPNAILFETECGGNRSRAC